MTEALEPSGTGCESPPVAPETMSPILRGLAGSSMAWPSLARRQTVFLSLVPLKFASSLWLHVSCFLRFIIPLCE